VVFPRCRQAVGWCTAEGVERTDRALGGHMMPVAHR
jgi:hypothetical protein